MHGHQFNVAGVRRGLICRKPHREQAGGIRRKRFAFVAYAVIGIGDGVDAGAKIEFAAVVGDLPGVVSQRDADFTEPLIGTHTAAVAGPLAVNVDYDIHLVGATAEHCAQVPIPDGQGGTAESAGGTFKPDLEPRIQVLVKIGKRRGCPGRIRCGLGESRQIGIRLRNARGFVGNYGPIASELCGVVVGKHK